jgi:hypothetical protein
MLLVILIKAVIDKQLMVKILDMVIGLRISYSKGSMIKVLSSVTFDIKLQDADGKWQ